MFDTNTEKERRRALLRALFLRKIIKKSIKKPVHD